MPLYLYPFNLRHSSFRLPPSCHCSPQPPRRRPSASSLCPREPNRPSLPHASSLLHSHAPNVAASPPTCQRRAATAHLSSPRILSTLLTVPLPLRPSHPPVSGRQQRPTPHAPPHRHLVLLTPPTTQVGARPPRRSLLHTKVDASYSSSQWHHHKSTSTLPRIFRPIAQRV